MLSRFGSARTHTTEAMAEIFLYNRRAEHKLSMFTRHPMFLLRQILFTSSKALLTKQIHDVRASNRPYSNLCHVPSDRFL